jgi:hypothetical protein
MIRRACLIFDSDSQYFACLNLVPYFTAAGWSLKFVVAGGFEPPASPLISPTDILRIREVEEIWQLPDLAACEAIGAYLPGSKLRRVWAEVDERFRREGKRPLLFTGYNGVVLVKFEEGISWRTGYDIIAMNSPEDREKALAFNSHCANPQTVPMPIVGINRTRKKACGWAPDSDPAWERSKRLIFAEQVLFPEGGHEKFYLYSHFLRLALANPEWDIVIKPRTLPGETTFHRQREHVSRFIARKFVLPPNMRICYDPLDELVPSSTVLLSISSTAFFDAVGFGIPAFTLSDFGISNIYGTQFFHGSGCTICLADLAKLSAGLFNRRPSEDWLEFKGFDSAFSPANVVSGLEELLASGTGSTAPLPYETEQRLLAPPAEIPPEFRTVTDRSIPEVGRKVMKYFSRKLADSRKTAG